MPLVKQLLSQFTLPHLHVVEPLQYGKGSYAGLLSKHRNHLHADINPVYLFHLSLHPSLVLKTAGKINIGKHFFSPPSHNQGAVYSCNLLSVMAAGENLPPLIDPDDPFFQNLHENIELTLQPD